jgi:hypothetical protein
MDNKELGVGSTTYFPVLAAFTLFKGVANLEHVMLKATGVAVGSLILLTAMVRTCSAAEQQFSCKGQIIDEGTDRSAQSKPIDLNVTLGARTRFLSKLATAKCLLPALAAITRCSLSLRRGVLLENTFTSRVI